MPRISICIEMIFTEVDFLKRPAAVAKAGFGAIEFWGSGNKDIDALRAACEDAGVAVASFGSLGGHTLVAPQDADALRARMAADAKLAARLGTRTLIATTGNEREGVPPEQQVDCIVANLQAVAPVAEDAGIRLALEPLNTLVDHAGYFLDSTADAVAIVERVGSPAVGILYDVYHMQIMEGNLIETIRLAADSIYHVHAADVPGRYEPGSGEINYANVFKVLDEVGYDGWTGMEFRPTDESAAALARMKEACGLR